MNYLTAAKAAEDFFIEKKSKFIGSLCPVKTEEEAVAFIQSIKAQHPQARHHVYAYILRKDNTMRYSDAGEPSGTGGQPMLGVLRREELTDVCVVATRYFGGILLGAGGLVRAYSHTAKLALEAAHIITYEQYTELELECSYSDYQRYLAELPRFGAITDDTQFSDKVNLLFSVKDTVLDDLLTYVREASGGKTEAKIRGHRFDYR
jgi:uncharacterized YigZ family protein